MKRFLNLIDYYAVIMLSLFIFYNVTIFLCLKISGVMYQIFMFILILLNAIILIRFRKRIKYKSIVIVVYIFLCFYSKDNLQCYFDVSNIVILCIVGFIESNFIKVISILISIFVFNFYLQLLFIFLIIFGFNLDDKSVYTIYDGTHYYCNNNYEAYAYSAGAMDRFHFSVGKHYTFLDMGDIIKVVYRERNQITRDEYEKYIKNNKCNLVEDTNGSK